MTITWIQKFQLFLFDFDGLLVNTEQLHYSAYAEMCRKRGFELKWDFQTFCEAAHFHSAGLREAIYAEFPDLYKQEPRWGVLYEEKKEAYMEILKSGGLKLMPGVETLLRALEKANIKRCVVTNSFKEQVDFIKNSLPILHSISLWITREQYSKPKPAPDAYLKAIEILKEPDDQVIGFEDSLRGIKSLKEANCRAVLICPPSHPQMKMDEVKEVAHFESFEQIPASWNFC